MVKLLLINILILLLCSLAQAKEFTFKYQYKDKKFYIKVDDQNKDKAFRKAANFCFITLTAGTYPGEEKGLDMIDTCANPR